MNEAIKNINEERQVNIESIEQSLAAQGLELVSERKKLSAGFNGPIYTLDVKDIQTGEVFQIVEKTFTYGGRQEKAKPGKRYLITETQAPESFQDVRARLGLVDPETGEINKVVVDWVYNEDRALNDLQGMPGIPKSYGPVYDGLKGSILEQKIEGYELLFLTENVESEEDIKQIFTKVKKIYVQAAEKGYIYNNPAGSSIIIEQETETPYFIDWYNHSLGSIDSDGPVKDKFEAGFRDLEDFENYLLDQFNLKNKKVIEA